MASSLPSIWLVARSHLARRRGEAFLIGTIIGLSALLFFTGVGILREVDEPFVRMFREQRGSHFTMIFDSRVHDIDRVTAWWRGRPTVASVSGALPVVRLDETSYFQGKELSQFLLVAERPVAPSAQDAIRLLEGKPAPYPARGEVWVSSSLAADAGIAIGSRLEIPGADSLHALTVSGIAVDPQFSAQFSNPTRIWVGPGELPYHFPATRLNDVLIGVRLTTREGAGDAWADFVRDMGGAFNGRSWDYDSVVKGYLAPYTLMAVMLVAFSALGLVTALLAIQGTITSAILADFKTIGVLRAQGFRPRDVQRVYEIQYLVLAAIALPTGLVAGVFVVRATIGILMATVGTPVGFGGLAVQAVITLIGFIGVIALFVSRVARTAGRVRPADAIRFGASSSAKARGPGLPISRLRALSIPLIIAIKSLGLQRRRTVFLAVSVVFATIAGCLAVNLDHSFQRMRTNLAAFGFDGANVRISRTGHHFAIRHDRLMDALRDHADVAAVATWDIIEGGSGGDSTRRIRTLTGTVVDGDMEGLQYANLRGRNPVGPGEISLAVRTAEALGKQVGDSIALDVFGAPLSFVLTGIYQSINNSGHGFRIRLEAARIASPLWNPTLYGVRLRPGADPERFIAAIEAEYGGAIDAKPGDYFIRDQLDSAMVGLRLANGFLAFVFLLTAAAFIFNTTLLTIAENRRMFGILKTTGMTPAELRASVLYGTGVIAAAGIAAGLLAWLLGAEAFLSTLFSEVGLVAFPLSNSVIGTALIAPLVLGFCVLSAWLPSDRVLRIDPRALIVE